MKTKNAVEKHLYGLGCVNFDVGVGDLEAGKFVPTKPKSKSEVLGCVKWLQHMNITNHHIYIRPTGSTGIVLIDDLSWSSVRQMERDGHKIAVLVETSPRNLQAWVRLQTGCLEKSLATRAARVLANRYGGDPNSADWRHFGRLAGFTNRKPNYLRNGKFPFVLLHLFSGELSPLSESILCEAEKLPVLVKKRSKKVEGVGKHQAGIYDKYAKRILIQNSHQPWSSSPDWSRMDWMIANDMADDGFSEGAIAEAIIQDSPDLKERHKGRHEKYVFHTVNKIFNGSG